MSRVEKILEEISVILDGNQCLLGYKKILLKGDNKEVFLWLDKKYREGVLPKNIEPLLKDLFFLLH